MLLKKVNMSPIDPNIAARVPMAVHLLTVIPYKFLLVFHVNKKFGDAVPDSALLIVVGLVLGYAIHSLNIAHDEWLSLKSQTFFLYLLPPIMLDAGLFHSKYFIRPIFI